MLIILATFVLGVITGVLLYRNNVKKLKASEARGKELLDALKGRNQD